MWASSYFGIYWAASYWPQTGAVGATPAPPDTGNAGRYLPVMGVGCWFLVMIFT